MLTTTATELPRLMVCIGSRLMPSPMPQGGNKEQRDEGNAAHWLAEQIFKGHNPPPGTVAPNGYVITDDMVEHVCSYVDAIDCGELECDTSYSGQGWEVRGRADHLKYRVATLTLTIDDFKYGWRIVEPDENYTLLSHAIGWCIRTGTRPDRIVLRIHQPRPYHSDGPLREWHCNYEQLMGYYDRIANRLANPTDELVTSLSQCVKCHARYDCRAFDQAAYNAIDVMGTAFDDTLPKHVLTYEYSLFTQAEAMIKIAREAREELISHRIKTGEVFDGYSLEQRYGQRRWKPGLTGHALSLASGKDLVKDGIVTPAEAERRGVPKEVIDKLVDRPLIDPKLKAIDVDAKARQIFGTGATP